MVAVTKVPALAYVPDKTKLCPLGIVAVIVEHVLVYVPVFSAIVFPALL